VKGGVSDFDLFKDGEDLCMAWLQQYLIEKYSMYVVSGAIAGINLI